MSYTLGPLAIGTAQPLVVPVGTPALVGAVVVGNESPYAVSAAAGGSAVWALAQMANRLNCDSAAFNGNVTLTADSYLTNENEAPSFVVFLEVYAPGEPVPGSYPCSLTRMSNVGNPSSSGGAANVIEQDLLTPFVLNGLVASKDGSIANQLDVTSGVALMRQADQSLGRITPASATFDTSAHTATYFLDLQTDGTFSWNTSHSTQPNYLSIAQVTTDGSGNISTVTDARVTASTLLSAMTGLLFLPNVVVTNPAEYAWHFGGSNPSAFEPILDIVPNGALTFVRWWLAYNGGDGHLQFQNTTGGVDAMDLDGSGNVGFAGAIIGVAGQTSVGSLGVPLIVAQAIDVHVTTTGSTNIVAYSVATTGLYRISGHISFGNTSSEALNVRVIYTDPHLGTPTADFATVMAATTPILLNGSASIGASQSLPLIPISVWAKSGQFLTFVYTDPGGTPNDFVSVIVERLA